MFVLHADVDSFFASVEQRDDPRLRGRPVIVGGGVVLAASYEAKARGVRTAMSGRRARRLCPEAIVVRPRMSAYSEASKAMYEVFEDAELDFLHPLPVELLWGVGATTARKLNACGITTVRQVAELDEAVLVAMLGRAAGRQLHALAHNRDPRPVQPRRRRGSIGSQRALGRSRRTPEEVDAVLVGLVERVTRRMRAAGRIGRTIVLRLRFADFSRATRSYTLPRPTAETHAILATARWLLAAATPTIERDGLTLVGVTVANLDDDRAVQLVFRGRYALDTALDEIRERFGTAAITRAV